MTLILTTSLTDAMALGQSAITADAAVIAKLTDMAGDFAVNLGVALLILCATLFAAKWASGGARRALVDRVLTDVGNHADLEQASARGKDWLFARDDRGRPMRAIHAAVPFGTEVEGAPLSDHFGYMIAYAPDGGKVQLVSREAVASWR